MGTVGMRVRRSALLLVLLGLIMSMTGIVGLSGAGADPGATTETTQAAEPTASSEPEPESEFDAEAPDAGKADQPNRAAAAGADSVVGITKETSLDGDPAEPGSEFTFILTARCSGLTSGCIHQSITDVLPAGLDVTSLPSSTATREVTYDAGTRTLTVTFVEDLQEPVGETGLNDGATRVLEIGMRVPANTPAPDGTQISNTATTVADNADPASDTATIVVSVPRDVKPVATKTWTDGSAVAGSGETSQVVLGIRNASSSSVTVDELRVTDATPGTYERFDLTQVEVTAFPAGADTARLLVCTAALSACGPADLVAGPATSAAVPVTLGLPAGVDPEDVTGFAVVFTDAAGGTLPYDATGGTVRAGLVLRDTVRSTGAPSEPTQKLTVDNCAVPAAVDELDEVTSGPAACDTYDILPSTVVVSAGKDYVADTDGDFTRENGEYAVVGEDSPVTATIRVQNKSAFPLREIRIVEPDASAPAGEFDKLEVTKVRLRLPSGATAAHLVVTYADGSADLVEDRTANATIDVSRVGTRPTRIEVVYTGVDGSGDPSIAIDATAYLDVHGTLNSLVTAQDLPNGTSPGVTNCARYDAKATTSNSTGTTSGTACRSLAVENPRLSGTGVKSASQSELPPGQPVDFNLTLRNNGNVPLVDPVLSDPPVEADGTPRAADNPFAVVRIVSATVRKDAGVPAVVLEVFDPTAGATGDWVTYVGSDTALLTRATGIRVAVDGELAPTKAVFLDLVTMRRDGIPDGVVLNNCYAASALGWDGDPVCSPGVESAPADSAAAINKSITPGQLVEPIPGVPQQTAAVRLTVANTGNMGARQLQLTDQDADFFDGVDFGRVASVQFPLGSDRVRIDAFDGTTWFTGVAVAKGASSFPLPAGITAADLQGIRATFTAASGGYDLDPCEGSPTPAACTGIVVLNVHPRQTLRSDPSTPIPDRLENTLVGGYETSLQAPGLLNPIDPVTADLEFVEGDSELDVDKTPNSAIVPGETAPFRLTVTNSGTSNLPDVVVRDLLPDGLNFDETFAADVGYRIVDVQVPVGTAQPPAPVFTTTSSGGRVTGLRWSFEGWVMRPGATFTIEIQVKLAPGVTEGQVNTNRMGATSPADGLACAPGTGTDTSGDFGSGTWCTDTAAVTTKAGAAFEARKWVAGNDSLGWFDNRAGTPVPVGDASCPSITEGGRTYTAFPCVALVNPGDRYDYLLRMVNSGTEPATNMRIIDRFPVQGDKGVVLSGTDRGTQWDNRPTLATAPVLIGSGVLTTSYAHSEAGVCTADLNMTAACGAGTWAAPFGPEAVAAQLRVTWATPLAPGQGVSIAFSMDTPLDVDRVADPTIAWNSFGHAETTLRGGGGTRVLPPTEPIQVGVALAYGTLRVEKELLANPGGLPVDDQEFEMEYVCTIDPIGNPTQTVAQGTLLLEPGESADVTGIPGGAVCEVWETDALGGVTNHPQSNPAVVTIAPQLGTDPAPATVVTVTNSYPLASLSVTKSVQGAAASYGASTTYPVQVLCSMGGVTATGFPVTVNLVGNDTRTVPVPVGTTCTATELDDGGATSSSVSPVGGVLITPGSTTPLTVTVTNTFEAGRLQILKQLSGAGSSLAEGPFEFEVACTFEGRAIAPVQVTVERDGDAADLLADVPLVLPIGAVCTVAETDDGGADATPPPVTVMIVQNAQSNTVQATFTNEFSAGTVALAKVLAGEGATAPYATGAVFTVDVACARGDATNVLFSAPVEIRGGERLELTDALGDPVLLPLGTRCWADETDTGGATSYSVNAGSYDEGLEVVSGAPDDLQTMELEVTNTFDLSSLVLDKAVDGPAAGYADGREFTVEVTCVLPQGGTPTPLLTDEPYTITAGSPVVIDELPIGAECWASETDAGGATSTVVEFAGPAEPGVITDEPRHLGITNTFAAGELQVTKRVVGGNPGPYSFTLACVTDQGDVRLAPGDASFELRAGETHTVSVPLGATCSVVETDVPSAAEVSFVDSDGRDDGSVDVDPRASVTVVNTFDRGVDDNDGDNDGDSDGDDDGGVGAGGDGVLPSTGGPELWLLLLGLSLALAGLVLVAAARHRGGVSRR